MCIFSPLGGENEGVIPVEPGDEQGSTGALHLKWFESPYLKTEKEYTLWCGGMKGNEGVDLIKVRLRQAVAGGAHPRRI